MKKEDYLRYGRTLLIKIACLFVSAIVMTALILADVDASVYTSLLAVCACYIAFYTEHPYFKAVALGATAATLSTYIYFMAVADSTGYGGVVMMLYMFIDVILITLGYPICKLLKSIFRR